MDPKQLASTWRKLRGDARGNVGLIFGLALLPVAGLAGAAVDYSRANAARTAMQSALDATALMLSKEAPSLSQTELDNKAYLYFTQLYTYPKATVDSLTTEYSQPAKGPTLKLEVRGHVDTMLVKVLGSQFNRMDIRTNATISWGSNRLRVALALDNTGSMASAGKMDSLKSATKDLLSQLKDASKTAGDVYVSIIPFAVHINGGAANYDKSWIDWTTWEAPPPNSMPGGDVGPGSDCPYPSNGSVGYKCTASPVNTPNCATGRGSGSACVSSIPSTGPYAGYICPSMENGRNGASRAQRYYNGCYNSVPAWSCTGASCSCGTRTSCTCSGSGSTTACVQTPYSHTWIPNNRNTWTGCLMDRGTGVAPGTSPGKDQTVDAADAGTPSTLFPADQYAIGCPQEMRALGNDWSAMNTFVDLMEPNGATNQPIGLVWAWQSLVGGGPLTVPAKDPGYTYDDIIILLSDGLNTQDRWYGDGSSTNTDVDGRMAGATGTCQNIKNAKITIYTVQVSTNGDPVSNLLKNCASDAAKFFYLTSGGQIGTTFKQIGSEIARLRISQ